MRRTVDEMGHVVAVLADGRCAHVVTTDRVDGDLAVGSPPASLESRRRRIAPGPWSWLHQVHGAAVVTVHRPGEHAGAAADAAVTACTGAVLAVHTADCAPVALIAPAGAIGVVHAGWRGLLAGVIPAAVSALGELGARPTIAVVGPCIHPGCYEFSSADLDTVTAAVGAAARGSTARGRPALDLPAAVLAQLAEAGIHDVRADPRCTACDPGLYSHRARGEPQRQALVAWLSPQEPG